MTDERKISQERFNEVAAGKPAPIRDKDNAQPDLKPDFANPAPNMAPAGMKGIQRQPQLPNSRQAGKQEELASIVKTHPRPELLTGGRFVDQPGHGFAVEVGSFRSIAGIEGGKINQLEIQQDGKIVAQYKDMRWTKIPEKEEHKQLVQRLQDQFGERRRDFVPIAPLTQDKDRGRDR